MRLIRGLTNLKRIAGSADSPLADGCVATIGNFDGVHRGGHKTIIDQVRGKAQALNLPSVVMIFEPQPPQEFFKGGAEAPPPRLMPFRQKFEALLGEGVDVVLCIRFDETFRSYSGMGFIEDVLIHGLGGVRHLVVGDDFRFGCDRAGDFRLLQSVGGQERGGFTVENTRTVVVDGERVSSTRVRNALNVNGLEEAERLLGGHPYRIHGRVVYGRQLGRRSARPPPISCCIRCRR